MMKAIWTIAVAVLLTVSGSAVAKDKDEKQAEREAQKKHKSDVRCELNDKHGDRRKEPADLHIIATDLDGDRHKGWRFKALDTRELDFIVKWPALPGAPGSQTQRIELYNPNGHVYQELGAAITTPEMHTRIPVAGTWITEKKLFGPWCAEVYLEGIAAPIAKHRFILRAPHDAD